jgi:hypothetical protein
VAVQICDCLANAHVFETTVDGERMVGIVHGDITPKNIRLDEQGAVKLLDFGIAKALSQTRKLTRNAFGSLPYLSPERIDTGEVDTHADLWSVGIVLYEMLAGVRPFRADNTRKLEKLILTKQLPPPIGDGCPAALRRITGKLLHPDLRARYSSAAAIKDDLVAFGQGRQTTAEREWEAECAAAEVTRRTRQAMDAATDDRTRRTEQSARVAQVAAPVAQSQSPRAATPRRRRRLRTVMWVLFALFLLNESRACRQADAVARAVPTATADQLDALWETYAKLSQGSMLRLGLRGLRPELKRHLVAEADRVIADYRRDVPTVREQQWRNAQKWLGYALALAPTDRHVEAALRYCEGHLQRIDGDARLQRRARRAATEGFHQAVQRFEEAAALNVEWPDPYLGLLQTYAYSLGDPERAVDALREAERRGFHAGNRESAEVGDAYRARGDRLRRDALGMEGLPQQKQYFLAAADSYRRALDLYRGAPAFQGVTENTKATQQRLSAIELRLQGLEPAESPAAAVKPSTDSQPWR